ncbi:putative Serine/threonine-protein phosphatase with EF-hands 1 [Blattamonas nauphoetae]|uniref:Serine/threonine-protein phosphatase n=1 Tax=Blattamonas nauphoetae TaxID=2049346 RepID=A0ABQ9X5N1_9EUKA|nr:putative Serine/threonine-protein phosphatase with EF-hands 1 [Blattamonas nauphoetae]
MHRTPCHFVQTMSRGITGVRLQILVCPATSSHILSFSALRHLPEALEDLNHLTTIAPLSQVIKERLKMCEDAISEMALIERFKKKGFLENEMLDWRTIPNPTGYTGPTLEEDDIVTDDFVRKVIDFGERFLSANNPSHQRTCYPKRLVLQLLERTTAQLRQEPAFLDLVNPHTLSLSRSHSHFSPAPLSPGRPNDIFLPLLASDCARELPPSPVIVPFSSGAIQSPTTLQSPPALVSYSSFSQSQHFIPKPSPAQSPSMSELHGDRRPTQSLPAFPIESPGLLPTIQSLSVTPDTQTGDKEDDLTTSDSSSDPLSTSTDETSDDLRGDTQPLTPDSQTEPSMRPSLTPNEAALFRLSRFDKTLAEDLKTMDLLMNPIILVAHPITFEMPDLAIGIDDRNTLVDVDDLRASNDSETVMSDSVSPDGRTSASIIQNLGTQSLTTRNTPLLISQLPSSALDSIQRNRDTAPDGTTWIESVFDMDSELKRECVLCNCGSFDFKSWDKWYRSLLRKARRRKKEKQRPQTPPSALITPSRQYFPHSPHPSLTPTDSRSIAIALSGHASPRVLDQPESDARSSFGSLQPVLSQQKSPHPTPVFITSQSFSKLETPLQPHRQASFPSTAIGSLLNPQTPPFHSIHSPTVVPLTHPTALRSNGEVDDIRLVQSTSLSQSSLSLPEHTPTDTFRTANQTISFAHRSTSTTPTNKQHHLSTPNWKVTVIGDIHGCFFDLLEILKHSGSPSSDHLFVFLGDFVDRGPSGVEVLVVLLSLKLANPNSVFLLRGNHESAEVNMYEFIPEVKKKYQVGTYLEFLRLYAAMPICALLDGKILCVHGGLPPPPSFWLPEENMDDGMVWTEKGYHYPGGSGEGNEGGIETPDLATLPLYYRNPAEIFELQPRLSLQDFSTFRPSDRRITQSQPTPSHLSSTILLKEMRNLKKTTTYAGNSLASILLWSDPEDRNGLTRSERGTGFKFGPDVTNVFLDETGLEMVIRAHEKKSTGFAIQTRTQSRLLTLDCAPSLNKDLTRVRGAWCQVVFDGGREGDVKVAKGTMGQIVRKPQFYVRIVQFKPVQPSGKKEKEGR